MKNEALKIDILYKELEDRIDAIKRKKNTYTWCYRSLRILTFAAVALITILTGWQEIPKDTISVKNWILIISTVITLFTALEGLFDLREKAMGYDVFLFELRKLRNQICYDFNKGPEVYEQNKDKHFEAFAVAIATQKSIIELSYEDEK